MNCDFTLWVLVFGLSCSLVFSIFSYFKEHKFYREMVDIHWDKINELRRIREAMKFLTEQDKKEINENIKRIEESDISFNKK